MPKKKFTDSGRPKMCISYLLSFIDKVALSNASILGIQEDDVSHDARSTTCHAS